jgi:hypothetical protein
VLQDKMNSLDPKKENSALYLDSEAHPISSVCYSGQVTAVQESISRITVLAENVSDKFSVANFGQNFGRKFRTKI